MIRQNHTIGMCPATLRIVLFIGTQLRCFPNLYVFSSDILHSTNFFFSNPISKLSHPTEEAIQLKVLFNPLKRGGYYVYHFFNNRSP